MENYIYKTNELYHHGIKGMKWGISMRRRCRWTTRSYMKKHKMKGIIEGRIAS